MDTCICMAESLRCSPEIIVILLISYTPIKSKKVILKKSSSVQSLSHVQLFATLWTTAHQASLSVTNSQSLLKLMSIELVIPSNHLILCRLLLLPKALPKKKVVCYSICYSNTNRRMTHLAP